MFYSTSVCFESAQIFPAMSWFEEEVLFTLLFDGGLINLLLKAGGLDPMSRSQRGV